MVFLESLCRISSGDMACTDPPFAWYEVRGLCTGVETGVETGAEAGFEEAKATLFLLELLKKGMMLYVCERK